MKTLLLSDLHLGPSNPHLTQLWQHFCAHHTQDCEAIYLLGDFFEYWVGDDSCEPWLAPIEEGFAELHAKGIRLYLMVGNRDFLLGQHFAKKHQLTLLPDPSVVIIFDKPYLLSHGDRYCTLDVGYQRYRRIVNQRWLQTIFTALPYALRRQIANFLRRNSSGSKPRPISDVHAEKYDIVLDTVSEALEKTNTDTLIHGHTHRPGITVLYSDEESPQTIFTLADWDRKGHVLCINDKNSLPTFESFD